jgi:hypothetical protein
MAVRLHKQNEPAYGGFILFMQPGLFEVIRVGRALSEARRLAEQCLLHTVPSLMYNIIDIGGHLSVMVYLQDEVGFKSPIGV